MLLGLACREAMSRRLCIRPLWSLFSPHGPVFRVMVRIERASSPAAMQRSYGYISYCRANGESEVLGWRDLLQLQQQKEQEEGACGGDAQHDTAASSRAGEVGGGDLPPTPCGREERLRRAMGGDAMVSGPLWTGALHEADYVAEMLALAKSLGWLGGAEGEDGGDISGAGGGKQTTGEMLELIAGEGDGLPPQYFRISDVGRVGKLAGVPKRDKLIAQLQKM
jgi:tRNA (guanine26-N2/guanine27-N2)-dimethyltransferase